MQNATKEKHQTDCLEEEKFLTGVQVRERYQRSHVTINRWISDPNIAFPKPMKVNSLNLWRLADLREWEKKQAGEAA